MRKITHSWVSFLFLIVGIGAAPSACTRGVDHAANPAASAPGAQADAPKRRVVFLGDSLTDGYGVDPQSTYPLLIESRLRAAGFAGVEVINASISGSTSASALARLKWQMKEPIDALVLALGANDGLRGLKLAKTEENLSAVIRHAQDSGVRVILAGMKLPPNYGGAYVSDFENLFKKLSKKHGTDLIPFLLEGVGGEPEMNQEDGIHPNEKGHRKMADTVYPHIARLFEK